ncbi:HAD family hydrolase [Winogradskyella endarachnes]|uniref:Cof-type HAD-IIB family hydrolase n=1 Tax=Winogradskyella endarachnes TaxID=2681965 RepID=A0A6L6UBY2_9FLAO|nr:HAD family hydrolase [Winogradskyella endarachnes]MUU79748.1 Cof-type HAD-IIB family hydrolase [Winogradskyella endarachnes]
MKHIKMIVTDMDGTLLNSNHKVSKRFFKIFEHLQQHNILFVAASGRPYYSIVEKLKSIKKDITIVVENGGLIIKDENVILAHTLNFNTLRQLYNLVININDTYPIFCSKDKAFILKTNDRMIETFSEYYSDYTIIDSLDDINKDIIKIALYHSLNSEEHIFPYVSHLSPELSVVVSGNNWVDISEAKTNKGYAITLIQKHYGISPEETMAFGDYNNDLELLKCAKYSYAMANAHSNVKAIANFETLSNDNFGVEMVLEKLISERSYN